MLGLWALWTVIVGVLASTLRLDAAIATLVYSLGALAFGYEADRAREEALSRRGMLLQGLSLGETPRDAERMFFDRINANMTQDAPMPFAPAPNPPSSQEQRLVSVAIIDYGSGNLHSALKAFERAARESGLGDTISIVSDPEAVRTADRIVLPGVGAFADCRRGLLAIDGMLDALTECVQRRATPFLGICVGMQLLADRGLEHGVTPGLGWIGGEVAPITAQGPGAENPAHGLEQLERERPRTRFSRTSRPANPACTPISSTPTICAPPIRRMCWRPPTTANL